jgi:thiamine biosynthesis lipoprotein ApbE
MQKYSLDVIGTHLDIYIDTTEDTSSLFENIWNRLQDFEKKYSRFLEWNWLSDLNKTRHWVLDRDSRNMIEYALEVAQNTNGYFDPTIGKRLTELGYGNKNISTLAGNSQGKKGFGDYRDIEIHWDEVILHGDIELEFGGVGKWYLIDIIKSMIDSWYSGWSDLCLQKEMEWNWCRFSPWEGGVRGGYIKNNTSSEYIYENRSGSNSYVTPPNLPFSGEEPKRFLINFGGDMYGRGDWRVGLESPFAIDEVIGLIHLLDDFLACSAGTKRKWGNHHHLIDPHTGDSATEVVATYIEWKSGISVDSYATALSVMSWNMACEVFKKTPEITGIIVSKEGNIFQKEGSWAEVFE